MSDATTLKILAHQLQQLPPDQPPTRDDDDDIDVDLHDQSNYHLCSHVFFDGATCRDVAEAGHKFCRWHSTLEKRQNRAIQFAKRPRKNAIRTLEIPSIEDAFSHQLALQAVIDSIVAGAIGRGDAKQLLYALQISQVNILGKIDIPRDKFKARELEKMLEWEAREQRDAARARAAKHAQKSEKKNPQSARSTPSPATAVDVSTKR